MPLTHFCSAFLPHLCRIRAAQECIMSCLQSKKLCPLCRSGIASKDLKAGLVEQQQGQQGEQEDWDAAAAKAAGGDGSRVVVCDSKLKVLLKVRGQARRNVDWVGCMSTCWHEAGSKSA
jgi:adenine-specific DNA methylase